jgi:hypothetical protein
VIYSSEINSFITIHHYKIKIWNEHGKHVLQYEQKPTNQITSAQMDLRQLKLFVGTLKGKIFTVSLKNGAKLRKYKKGGSFVKFLFNYMVEDVMVAFRKNKMKSDGW